MQELAADKLDLMRQKEWVVRWRGKDVFEVRKVVQRIVSTVQQCSGLIGQAVSYAPSPATPAWAGICVLMTLVTADSEERSKAIEGLDKVSVVIARTAQAEKSYFESTVRDQMFEKVMVELYCGLVTFCAKAACYFSRYTITRFARNIIQYDDWSGVLDDIDQKDREAFRYATTLSLSVLTEDMRDLKISVNDDQKKTHLEKLLHWTCPISVGDQHRDAKQKLGDQYLSSGKWLLDHYAYVSWKQDKARHFWLQGSVGTGKTSLVAILIERLRPKLPNFAYFYCSSNMGITDPTVDVAERAPEFILRSLVAQLALSPDGKDVAAELELAFEASRRKGCQGTTLSQAQSLELLVQIIESRDNATIIIDALDECPKYSAFLTVLKQLAARTERLKLFVSSQPQVPVTNYLEPIAAITITFELNAKDMATFIKKYLDSFMKIRAMVLEKSLQDDLETTLAQNSDGM
jgi:hypothetical protein